jgi:hypothetical protein
MAELDWPMSEVMQEHLQNLISQGYMIALGLRRGVHCVL